MSHAPLKLLRGRRPEPTGLVGPESMILRPDRIEVNGCLHQSLFVKSFPREAEPGWLSTLYSFPGRLDVSLHVVPVPTQVSVARLKKQRARHESTVLSDLARGHITDPEIAAAARDASDLMSAVATGESRIFLLGIYLTVRGWSEDELAGEVQRIEGLCASLGLDVRRLRFRGQDPWVATLPLGIDPLRLYHPVDTAALAACFPFSSAEIGSDGGVLYGRNIATGGIVLVDRFALENYNQLVLAHSGKGKSYFAKLQILRSLYEGIEAIVIDPENEYLLLAEAVGGAVVKLGGDGARLNPLQLDETGQPDALIRQSLFVHTVVDCLLGELPQEHRAALDRAIIDAYASAGITADPRTHRRPAPLLADVVEELRSGPGEGLARRLEPFTSGSYRGLFDAQTTVRPEGHLVVYSLKDVHAELKSAATLLVLESISQRISNGEPKKRIVVVDEAWLLLQSASGARFLERLARSARKHWCGLTTITQDVRDALSTEIGRTVLTNASSQVLFGQHPQALEVLAETFSLSEGERSYLSSCPPGQGLVCVGAERATVKVVASEYEHRLVTSDPAETAEATES